MKPSHLTAIAAVALAVVTVPGAPAASSVTCGQTDAVLYSTDTVRLAGELQANAEPCTDYYISITPMTPSGAPRGGAPLTAIHNGGARFHALAEIRLPLWGAYAAEHGWHAAGLEVRRLMALAGYDDNDSWIINEVGAPATSTMGVAVFRDEGTARDDLREFLRGLATGDNKGAVFAAQPFQLAASLDEYRQGLTGWYSDAEFWSDLSHYVRFWAQETYADSRAWGVAGSTLAERAVYLNDYFQHGRRFAAGGGRAMQAARTFFERTYVPLSNAAFRHGLPNPSTGIGFGFTEVPIATMQSFIAEQTYAMRVAREAERLGYAFSPRSGASTATELTTLANRVALAIRDSAADPLGACGSSGEWCGATIEGAQFTDAWKTFANTLEGAQVHVQVDYDVDVTFMSVQSRGATWAAISPLTASPPAGVATMPGALLYELATSAAYTGSVEVCLAYDASSYSGYSPRVFTLGSSGWTNVTRTVDSAVVCGNAPSLGPFAVFAQDATPPRIVPNVAGPLGSDGWYVGDVVVSWVVTDPESAIVSSGCVTTTVASDTTGTTFVCTATSAGGTASRTVVVKRDATPPSVACEPTPDVLWPPTGKLVPVTVAVQVTDVTSGPDGFVLAALDGGAAEDRDGFAVGTPDVAGSLRAKRAGAEEGRSYVLTYSARDRAGNDAACVATVVVPHDQGG